MVGSVFYDDVIHTGSAYLFTPELSSFLLAAFALLGLVGYGLPDPCHG